MVSGQVRVVRVVAVFTEARPWEQIEQAEARACLVELNLAARVSVL